MPSIEQFFDNPDYNFTFAQVKEFSQKVAKVDDLLNRVLTEINKYPDFKAKEAGEAVMNILNETDITAITPTRIDMYLGQAVDELIQGENQREALDAIQAAGKWFRDSTFTVLQGVGSKKK